MSQSLLLFTIGPVQSFISQARKTQDLYAGSFIMSHLCKTAMIKAIELEAEVLFPDVKSLSVPNRFIAVINSTIDSQLERIGQDIEAAVKEEFSNMACHILKDLGLKKTVAFTDQINSFLEVYWVFVPFDKRNYAEGYRKLNSLMGGVKNTRTFQQFQQEPGRKCSLSGEHNILFYRSSKRDKKYLAPPVQLVNERLPLRYLAEGEGLGATSFIKRCADIYFNSSEYEGNFESTARIALMDVFNELRSRNPIYDKYLEAMFDEELIFDLFIDKEISELADKESTIIAKEIYKGFKKNEISVPSPYYAVLVFDGDSMGRWYSTPPLLPNKSIMEFHKVLSKKITEFAREVQNEILIPPRGKTVYAGGEDFLGFVNLRYLFQVMEQLRRRFAQIDLLEFTVDSLSFSAGIVIAHIKTPLSEVLKWAKDMEQQAKRIDAGKDAFGVAILKHSGEIHRVTLKWKYGEHWTTSIMEELTSKRECEKITANLVKNLEKEFLHLTKEDADTELPFFDNMVRTEIGRLVKRSWMPKNIQSDDIVQIEELSDQLYSLYLDSGSFSNFMNTLKVIEFLARNRGA